MQRYVFLPTFAISLQKTDIKKMTKQFTLKSGTDIFDYNTGWFGENSTGNLFNQLFGTLPSIRKLRNKQDRTILDEIKEMYQTEEDFQLFDNAYYEYDEEEVTEEEDEDEDKEDKKNKEHYECFIICKKNLLVAYFDQHIYIAYSGIDTDEINRLMELGNKYKQKKENLDNLFIVSYEHNYFCLKPSRIKETDINIHHHYNDDFAPVTALIEDFITSDNNSGLVILHGKQGTGKTTYIRHLISRGKRKMIYMGGDLIDRLSDPSFMTFVRQQKNATFIVEDCEELLASRNKSSRMNSGLINILNISDGLLGDELSIKFICTFNAPLQDIDEALLRKGRLVARYEFKDLETEKVNRIIREEGLNIPLQENPMSLAELYNYEGSDFSLGRKKVGF